MFGQRHHHAAGEVFIALNDVDVGGSDPGHAVERRCERFETGAGILRRIVRHRSTAISSAGGRTENIGRLAAEIPDTFLGYENDGGGAVIFHAAIVEVKRLGDPARGVVLGGIKRLAVHHRARIRLRVMV